MFGLAVIKFFPTGSFFGRSRISGICWHAGRTEGIYPKCQPQSGMLTCSPVNCNKPLQPTGADGTAAYSVGPGVLKWGQRACTTPTELEKANNINTKTNKGRVWQISKMLLSSYDLEFNKMMSTDLMTIC